ncbi:carotenoid biosynthesis protein [Nonlabens xiamenensis]|uniref:carotenoid biosynthesis protein n=1 Tax=Nonlabens xiamenensis TaxID=2341043 RepID=UPI000F6089CB|nr:carotenoid biosynthesis protein [Nonlabens xiamenensis]
MKQAAIVFLWIIHIAALIGIGLGYASFFLPKSPFTMLYLWLVLIFFFPFKELKTWILFMVFMAVGMIVEWLGVHTGWLFGQYVYGESFGWKLDGIPWLIGVNWAILTFCCHIIAKKIINSSYGAMALGATFMVLLDFFLEQICDYAGFWHFAGGAGWFNYICWWIIGFALQAVASRWELKGDFNTCLHLYVVQLIFALGLWIIIMT